MYTCFVDFLVKEVIVKQQPDIIDVMSIMPLSK